LNELGKAVSKTIRPEKSFSDNKIPDISLVESGRKLSNNIIWKNASSIRNHQFKSSQKGSLKGSVELSWNFTAVDFISVYDQVALIANNYKNQVQIGEGSYGTVEKAQHIDTDRLVALKHKKSVCITSGESPSIRKLEERATFVHEMAVNEYKILAQLDHPNILKLYEVYHDDQTKDICIVTEFVKGKTLFQEIGH